VVKEIKRTSDNTHSNNIEEPKSPDTWRRMCKQADQTRQQTAEKQIVLSDRATPENPGLYGGMWKKLLGKHDKEASSSRDSSDRRTDSIFRHPEGLILKRTLYGHTSFVNSVALSADGKTLASGSSGDNIIKIWGVE
jgi:WD40 repeat protein